MHIYLLIIFNNFFFTVKLTDFSLLFLQTLKPDPILSLKRVVGFGGGTFREVMELLTKISYLQRMQLHKTTSSARMWA